MNNQRNPFGGFLIWHNRRQR